MNVFVRAYFTIIGITMILKPLFYDVVTRGFKSQDGVRNIDGNNCRFMFVKKDDFTI